MKKIAILIFLVHVISLILAQEFSQTDFARCVSIVSDNDRLACYDGVAQQLAATGLSTQASNGQSKWRVHEDIDAFDDSRIVVLVLDADEGLSRWGDSITLLIRCQTQSPDVYIVWGDYLGSEAMVTHRIGSGKAVTREWSLSTDSEATFYPSNTITLLKELIAVDRFVAQVTPYSESPVTAIFDTHGLENVINPYKDICQLN